MNAVISAFTVRAAALTAQYSRPPARRPEVATEATSQDQLSLSGVSFAPSPVTAQSPAATAAPLPVTGESPAKAPVEQPDPGPGVAFGQGGTLLMTDTPSPKHSDSIDGFLANAYRGNGLRGALTRWSQSHKTTPGESNPYTRAELDDLAKELSLKIQATRSAGRQFDRILTATKLEDRIGEQFPATVVGIRGDQVTVRIAEPRAEGTLHNAGGATLGEFLQAQLSSVNTEKGSLDFLRATLGG